MLLDLDGPAYSAEPVGRPTITRDVMAKMEGGRSLFGSNSPPTASDGRFSGASEGKDSILVCILSVESGFQRYAISACPRLLRLSSLLPFVMNLLIASLLVSDPTLVPLKSLISLTPSPRMHPPT